MKITHFSALALVALALTACGGGGGDTKDPVKEPNKDKPATDSSLQGPPQDMDIEKIAVLKTPVKPSKYSKIPEDVAKTVKEKVLVNNLRILDMVEPNHISKLKLEGGEVYAIGGNFVAVLINERNGGALYGYGPNGFSTSGEKLFYKGIAVSANGKESGPFEVHMDLSGSRGQVGQISGISKVGSYEGVDKILFKGYNMISGDALGGRLELQMKGGATKVPEGMMFQYRIFGTDKHEVGGFVLTPSDGKKYVGFVGTRQD